LSSKLRPVSYALFALIGEGGASAHDLVRMVRQGAPIFLTAATSLVYAEPKRLERLGYLSAEVRPGKTTPRTVYRLTAKGRAALVEWLRAPSPFPRIQHEASLRLLAGDMLCDDEILASLSAMRGEIDRIEKLVDEMESHAAEVPHRERYLQLNQRLARGLLDAHRAWLDEVERELGSAAAAASG
jgi:PadR family transcriptional regulator AphA